MMFASFLAGFLPKSRLLLVLALQSAHSLTANGTRFNDRIGKESAQSRHREQAPTICIDPGHPSEVSVGTHGRHVTEVTVAWQIGLLLRGDLERMGYRVVMTKRSEMQRVSNRERAEIANRCHAAILLRLHLDAGFGSGFASYYPGRQGIAQGHTGPSAAIISASHHDAEVFHHAVIGSLKGFLADRGLHTDESTFVGGKHGGALIGSVFSQVPVILVEMAVLTSPKDEKLVSGLAGQKRVADALAEGVRACVPVL